MARKLTRSVVQEMFGAMASPLSVGPSANPLSGLLVQVHGSTSSTSVHKTEVTSDNPQSNSKVFFCWFVFPSNFAESCSVKRGIGTQCLFVFPVEFPEAEHNGCFFGSFCTLRFPPVRPQKAIVVWNTRLMLVAVVSSSVLKTAASAFNSRVSERGALN